MAALLAHLVLPVLRVREVVGAGETVDVALVLMVPILAASAVNE